MQKAEALLRAAIAARRTGRTMYVYPVAGMWAYASASWIAGMDNQPNTLIEVQP